MDSDPFQLAGSTLDGRYRIDRVVGEGGFGIVYRGLHLSFEQPIAVKCLKVPSHFTPAAKQLFLDKFREEGKHLARLAEHPSIVRVYDFGLASRGAAAPLPYLVLEWLDGKDLRQLLGDEDRAPLSESQAVAFLEPIIDAIRLAHLHGIAHRDLKPANVFLARTLSGWRPKVLDFGIAKGMQEGETATQLATRTSSGFSAFSPQYGAPEQFRSSKFGPTGPWTDVHALGLILVELVTGAQALEGTEPGDFFVAATDRRRPTPRVRGVQVSDVFEAICGKALALAPKERYRDAGEMLAALQAVPRLPEEQPGAWPWPLGPSHDPPAGELPASEADGALDTGAFLERHRLRDGIAKAVEAPSPPLAATALEGPAAGVGLPATVARGPGRPVEPRTELASPAVTAAPDHTYGPLDAAAGPTPTTVRQPPLLPDGRGRTLGAVALLLTLAALVVFGASAAWWLRESESAPATTSASATSRPARVLDPNAPTGMITVPAGELMMGCADDDAHCADDERPAHVVQLSAFYIDETEVTVAEYRRCVAAGGCSAADGIPRDCNWHHEGRQEHPVNCVTWPDANDYCRHQDKRLPTEAEWERAARGADGRPYPWGEASPSCALTVMADGGRGCGRKSTWPAGSMATDVSAFGVLDMGGNLQEWVADGYDAGFYASSPARDPVAEGDGGSHVTRGGSWYHDDRGLFRSAARNESRDDHRNIRIGFRCARDAG